MSEPRDVEHITTDWQRLYAENQKLRKALKDCLVNHVPAYVEERYRDLIK